MANMNEEYGFFSKWMADIPPSTIIATGTVVRLNDVWGHTAQGVTEGFDVVWMAEEECELGSALAKIEKIAIAKLRKKKSQLRYYFIEDITIDPSQNGVTFHYGT